MFDISKHLFYFLFVGESTFLWPMFPSREFSSSLSWRTFSRNETLLDLALRYLIFLMPIPCTLHFSDQ